MQAVVIDDIPFRADQAQLLRRLRLERDTPDAERAFALLDAAEGLARPKALYGVAYIDERTEGGVVIDGIRFTSRVLSVNLEKVHRVFPFVATCGLELEEWSETIDDMLERWWTEAIRELALGAALTALIRRIREEFGVEKLATLNPGSTAGWLIQEQKALFRLLGDPAAIGVRLSASSLMHPIKSISGLRYETEVQFENCQLCPREDCPGRRAPYEPNLYRERYAR